MKVKRIVEEHLRGWLPKEPNTFGSRIRHMRTPIVAVTATILIISSVYFAMFFGKPSMAGPVSSPVIIQGSQFASPSASPSPPAVPTLPPSPASSPSPTPYNGYMSQPPSIETKTVKTYYAPLPTTDPEEGIAVLSITCCSIGEDFFQRSLSSRVTNVVVKNFETNDLTAVSLTLYGESPSGKNSHPGFQSSFSISVVIPANSTIDISTNLLPHSWTGSGSASTTLYYVVVETIEGYTATSDHFAFPVLDNDR